MLEKMRGRFKTIVIKCQMCTGVNTIHCTKEQYDEWFSKDRRMVQEIFPNHTREERELLISKMCGKCFAAMFPIEEEVVDGD